MASLRLAIDLSGRVIRVLEGTPGGPMRCGELGVPDGALQGGRVLDPAVVGNSLRQLLARTEVSGSRALIVASDVIASFRVLHFPEGTDDGAIDAAVRSQLPTADGRLAIRHLEVPTSRPGRTVYATAWDRDQVKAIADSVRHAGLDPGVVDLKSLCIARAVPVESCVILDASVVPCEVLVIEDHIPRIWHSFTPPPDGDQGAALAAGVKPVLGYYRQMTGSALPAAWPLLVRADLQPPASVSGRLAELSGLQVEPLPRPARVDPELRFGPYLACVGLLMRRRG